MKSFKVLSLALITSLSCSSAFADRLWTHTIHDGRDPLTPPHTRLDCVNWAYPWPGAKICVGHKLSCQFMESRIAVIVEGTPIADYAAKAQRCGDEAVRNGVIAGVIAAAATGGISAADAFMSAAGASFTSCIQRELSGAAPTVRTENPTHWGEWGSC